MRTKKLHSRVLFVLALILVATPACIFQDEDEDPELVQIEITVEAFDFYFDPTTVMVDATTEATITLQNGGGVAHSFTVPDLDIDIVAESANSVSTSFVTPEEPAAYEFYCKFHRDEMSGSFSVGTDEEFEEEDVTDTETEEAEDI